MPMKLITNNDLPGANSNGNTECFKDSLTQRLKMIREPATTTIVTAVFAEAKKRSRNLL